LFAPTRKGGDGMRSMAFLVMALVLAVGSAHSQNVVLYTDPPGTSERDTLRYNAMTKEWQYVPPRSELRYHPFEKRWDFVEPEKQLKYNAMERRWEWAR